METIHSKDGRPAVSPKLHVSLYVSHIGKTVDFYQNFFGQKAEKQKLKYAKFELENPGLVISFVENAERVQPNFGHLGLRVNSKEELMQRLQQFQNQQLPIKEEMGVKCCYSEQDKFWAQDPDGHQWEIYHFHQDVEFNDPAYDLNPSTSSGQATENCARETAEPSQEKEPAMAGDCCAAGSNCC